MSFEKKKRGKKLRFQHFCGTNGPVERCWRGHLDHFCSAIVEYGNGLSLEANNCMTKSDLAKNRINNNFFQFDSFFVYGRNMTGARALASSH